MKIQKLNQMIIRETTHHVIINHNHYERTYYNFSGGSAHWTDLSLLHDVKDRRTKKAKELAEKRRKEFEETVAPLLEEQFQKLIKGSQEGK